MVLLTVAGAGFLVQWALSEYPLSRFKMALWLSPPPNCIRKSHAPTKTSGTKQPLKNPNEIYKQIYKFTNRPKNKVRFRALMDFYDKCMSECEAHFLHGH